MPFFGWLPLTNPPQPPPTPNPNTDHLGLGLQHNGEGALGCAVLADDGGLEREHNAMVEVAEKHRGHANELHGVDGGQGLALLESALLPPLVRVCSGWVARL